MGNICKKCKLSKNKKPILSKNDILDIDKNNMSINQTNQSSLKCKHCNLYYSNLYVFDEYCSDECYWNAQMSVTI